MPQLGVFGWRPSRWPGVRWTSVPARRGTVAALLTLGTMLAAPVSALHAQETAAGGGVALPTDSDYQVLWQRLEEARTREDWTSLLSGLDSYSRLWEQDDLNPVIASGGGLALGIRRLLASLPASLPATLRERFRERLDAVLDEAWARSQREETVAERRRLRHQILRDYPLASVFVDALKEEIDDAFERAQWTRSRQLCLKLLSLDVGDYPGLQAADTGRSLLYLLQIARVTGRDDLATLRDRLKAHHDLLRGEDDTTLSEQIQHVLSNPSPPVPRGSTATPDALELRVFTADETAPRENFLLGEVLWRQEVATPQLRRFVDAQARVAPGKEGLLAFHPALRGSSVVFQHADRLTMLDKSGGRPETRWSIPVEETSDDFIGLRRPLLSPRTCFYVTGDTIRAIRLTDGTPLWTTAPRYDVATKRPSYLYRKADVSDATRATLEELPPAPSERGGTAASESPGGDFPRETEEETQEQPVDPGDEAETTDDAGTDADEAPQAGEEPQEETGARGEDAPADGEADAEDVRARVYLTSPVFFADKLVVGIRYRIESESLLYLASLDQEGQALWTTFLGSIQTGDYLGLAGAGSLPLVRDGIVYFLTNQGIAAAVDAQDGAIVWLSEYTRLSPSGEQEAIRTEDRWQPNPLLPIGSSIVMAPQDSPFLMALDAASGHLDWRVPRERSATLIGANDEACFVAGAEIAALRHSGTARGQLLWSFAAEEASFLPLGRAALVGSTIFLSGRNTLVRLSARSGDVLSRTLWDFTGGGGNLLLMQNSLAVTTPEAFFVYGHIDDQAREVKESTRQGPTLLLRQARFHLKNAAIRKGLDVLAAWSRTNPSPPVANSEVDHLQLSLAEMCRFLITTREGDPLRRELLEARLALERTAKRRVHAAIDVAEFLMDKGEPVDALTFFHRALLHNNPPLEYFPDGTLKTSVAAYVRDRIASLRRATPQGETAFETVEKAAHALHREARKNGTPPSYLEVLRIYPYTRAAAEAYLDLFTSYQDRKSYSQALGALENYLQDFSPSSPTAVPLASIADDQHARIKLIVAGMLYQGGRVQEAKEYYLDLLKNHGNQRLRGMPEIEEGETVAEHVKLRLRDPGLSEVPEEELPKLRLPARMSWRSPADLHASSRSFLVPQGDVPPKLKNCFLVQSTEILECRRLENGLPLWRVHLDLIPGFELDEPFRFRSRTGRRALRGAYLGSLLVLRDHYNLLAIDTETGRVRWHVPFSADEDTGTTAPAKGSYLRRLRETLRGFAASSAGVFAVSSRNLYHYDLDGQKVWEVEIDYDAGLHPASAAGGSVFVHAQRPMGLRVHDASTGDLQVVLGKEQGFDKRLVRSPIRLAGDRLLLAFGRRIVLFDLSTQDVVWTHELKNKAQLEELAFFPEAPDECIAFINRTNNWPAMIALSVKDGKERWRYEKFPAKQTTFSVFREGNQLFVVHGQDKWSLLALELRSGPAVQKSSVVPLWPQEMPLGTFYSGSAYRHLHIAEDAVLFADVTNTSFTVFDRATGGFRPADARILTQFLADKRNFSSSVFGGKLVLLTSNGDAAFEPVRSKKPTRSQESVDLQLVHRFLKNPGDTRTAIALALQYFRRGDHSSALKLLNRCLLSEEVLLEASREERKRLTYLLDGIKQERMKESAPEILSRRFRQPPRIDGELNDSWDITSRIYLTSPLNVGTVPVPSHTAEWEGLEDLSAVLYTGWDEDYFYFALDVSDDVLVPYDRDAKNWSGDCLLIGLDPTGDGGFHYRGNDQLMTLALTVPKRNPRDKEDPEGDEDGEESKEEDEQSKPDGMFSVKKKSDDSGAIYEVALPWETFSRNFRDDAAPRPGYVFGLSLLLTDDDTTHGSRGQGATRTLSLNPCHLLPRSQRSNWVWRYIIPNFFPKVRLE